MLPESFSTVVMSVHTRVCVQSSYIRNYMCVCARGRHFARVYYNYRSWTHKGFVLYMFLQLLLPPHSQQPLTHCRSLREDLRAVQRCDYTSQLCTWQCSHSQYPQQTQSGNWSGTVWCPLLAFGIPPFYPMGPGGTDSKQTQIFCMSINKIHVITDTGERKYIIMLLLCTNEILCDERITWWVTFESILATVKGDV